jgi:hypothetical protein
VKPLATIFISLLFASANFAQAKGAQDQRGNSERLGMTCAQVLAMSSTDWVAKFTATKGATPKSTVLAMEAYAKCYDARTDRLAASLAKAGKGPLMGARANFHDFEEALNNFTAKAFSVGQTPADAVKTACAALYEKQFRYSFYQSYQQKPPKEPAPTAKDASAALADPAVPATNVQSPSAARITDPMSLAKNRFGEILAALADDERHQIHLAFGEIFEKNSIGEQWKLEIYRYAIFILESPKNTPFSRPPF